MEGEGACLRCGHCFKLGELQLGLSYVGKYGMDEQEMFHLGAQGPSSPLSKPHWCPGPQVTGQQTFNITECQSWPSVTIRSYPDPS